MGLFSHKETAPPAPVHTARDAPRSGLFNRHRSVSPETKVSTGRTGGGLLHRNHEDKSITAARQRVMDAESAERDADRALVAARGAVKDARDQVRALELEAKEEARLAKAKQKAAGDISKRARPLGRHDRF